MIGGGTDLGRAFDGLAYLFIVLLCLSPLGIWKLIEITIWLFQHVKIVIG